jgi:phage/plasmid-associated DNA primase
MKGLSGNDEQTTRELFKSSTTWKPTFKMFLLSNGDLNIDSIDEALWMRIQINKFKVWFKDNPNPNSPYEAQIDRSLKSILETNEYKEALLWLLIEFAKELICEFKINVPTSILENNSNIRSSSDSYTKWFNETYYVNHEEIQLTEYLCINRQLKSLWEKYQRSTYFTKRKDSKSDLKRALEVLGLECIEKFQPYLIDELGNKKQHTYRSYFKGIILCDE